MKVLIDIENRHAPSIMEILKSLKFIRIMNEIKSPEEEKLVHDLDEAFSDIKLHLKGKKKLKTAKALLNEL